MNLARRMSAVTANMVSLERDLHRYVSETYEYVNRGLPVTTEAVLSISRWTIITLFELSLWHLGQMGLPLVDFCGREMDADEMMQSYATALALTPDSDLWNVALYVYGFADDGKWERVRNDLAPILGVALRPDL